MCLQSRYTAKTRTETNCSPTSTASGPATSSQLPARSSLFSPMTLVPWFIKPPKRPCLSITANSAISTMNSPASLHSRSTKKAMTLAATRSPYKTPYLSASHHAVPYYTITMRITSQGILRISG
ncbi:hypothetical protein FGO68_gene2872 [Halteria grandinella]|uniref:Uncharacterized protein n=1 Tax=Halteria grandinella TaxID=5974 RepID=A0A8J8N932_HALGN|nr:hypothetical protein FGO68_gene2872 [Halteria grandinella]